MTTATVDNAAAVAGLEPALVFRYFADLASVPRPSHHEERIQAHALALASSLGFDARRDDAGNIVIDVPATPGREGAPSIVLQGHLDMVAEKNRGVEHDFEQDPIRLVVDADGAETILRADGTTLGADNGIGVALGLAAATDPDLEHGPLELLLTSDEEVGMTGAKQLVPESVRGRRLINLDSEEDDAIYIGCAGGCDVGLRWSLPLASSEGLTVIEIAVAGLRGGHSGCDIHLGRVNAIKHAIAVWERASDEDARLVGLDGGSKRNAIPREAHLRLAIDPARREAYAGAALALADRARQAGEGGVTVRILDAEADAAAPANDSVRLLRALHALPSGVLAVVPTMPQLVQTSNNLSTAVSTTDGRLGVECGCMTRSSLMTETEETASRIVALGTLGGAQVEVGNAYPGWQPSPASPMLETARALYRELFGSEPAVTAIHAGLECGIIGERVGSGSDPLDMISIGPRIEGAHSPDERVYPASVEKSYRFLAALLERLSR